MNTESDGLDETTDSTVRLPSQWTQAEWQAELAKTKPATIIAFLRANKMQPSAFRLLPELVKLPTNQLLIAQTLVKTPRLAAKWATSEDQATTSQSARPEAAQQPDTPRVGLPRMQKQKPVGSAPNGQRAERANLLALDNAPKPNDTVPASSDLRAAAALQEQLDATDAQLRDIVQQLEIARAEVSRLEAELATQQRSSKFATEFVERIQDVIETERGTDFRKYPVDKRPARLKAETLKVLRNESNLQAEIDGLRKQLKAPSTLGNLPSASGTPIGQAIAPQVKAAMQAIMLHGKAEWNAIQRLVNLLLQDKSLSQVDIATLRHLQAVALLRGKRDDEALALLGEAIRLFISKKRYDDALECLVLALHAISSDAVSPDVISAMRALVSQVPDDSMRKLVHPLARLRSRNRKAFDKLLPRTLECASTNRLIAGVDSLATRRITDSETLSLPLASGRRHSCTVREIIRRVERGDESYIARVREGLELLLEMDDSLALAIETCIRDSSSPWALVPLHNHHWRAAVIDASNVARWNSGKAGDKSVSHASRILAIWQQLVMDGYFPVNIYADANLRHNVMDPDVITQLQNQGSLHITHGEEADVVILKWAGKHDAIVITNDRNMLSAHIDAIAIDDSPERAGFEFTKAGFPKIHGISPFRRETQPQPDDHLSVSSS
ncbi:MAG: NYN domain-containing protein [Armatimonadota bacterium]